MEIDDNVFNNFLLFQARIAVGEIDYNTVLNVACEHFQCDKNSITANMFLAFVYAVNLCDNKKLTD